MKPQAVTLPSQTGAVELYAQLSNREHPYLLHEAQRS